MIFKHWNFLRVIRLAAGVVLMVEAVNSANWFLVLVGAVFVSMPLLNIGCCTTGICSTYPAKDNNATDEIEFKEIN